MFRQRPGPVSVAVFRGTMLIAIPTGVKIVQLDAPWGGKLWFTTP